MIQFVVNCAAYGTESFFSLLHFRLDKAWFIYENPSKSLLHLSSSLGQRWVYLSKCFFSKRGFICACSLLISLLFTSWYSKALSFCSSLILLKSYICILFSDLFVSAVLVPKNWCKRSLLIRLLMSRKRGLQANFKVETSENVFVILP